MKKVKQSEQNSEPVVRRKLVSGAAILAVGSIVAKLLGALYRIPLTNILGAEGMGMYQLVFPVYALFMTLSTAGIPTALSRIVAEKRAMAEPTRKYLFSAMLLLATLGAMFTILTFSLSKYIAIWQGNEDTTFGFMIIAPSILIVCLISGFRGWFQGQMYMLPTAVSNIVEQVVKLAVGIGLSVTLLPRGVEYAVFGALLGVTLSEVCALAYLFVTYFFKRKEDKGRAKLLDRNEARQMFSVIFNIAFVAILLPLSNFFDSIIIVNMLKLAGLDSATATAQYGLYSGPVNSLINMPIVVIMSLAIAIVPAVSMSRVRRDIDSIMLKSRLSIKIAYLLGVPFAFFFAVFAPRILKIVYPTLSPMDLKIATNLLRISSANVVLLSSMQIYVSLLQALDKTKYAILSLVCAIIVKIVLSLVLVRFVGIVGASIASFAMATISLLGVNISYFRVCGLHLEKNVAINLLLGVIMAIVGFAICTIDNDIVCLVVGAVVCSLVYVWLVFLFNLIDKNDIPYLPARRVLFRLHRLIRFWEYGNETR